MTRTFLPASIVVAVALSPAAAMAHAAAGGSHAHGLAEGIVHPLFGVDHLAAMVAVGLIAACAGGVGRFGVPGAFLAAMLVGSGLGMTGIALPAFETGIGLSLVVLGALVAIARPLPFALSIPLVALFGLAHGNAHGIETPVGVSGAGYMAGFLLATAALHAAGLLAGLKLAAQRVLLAGTGAATAVGGVIALTSG